MTRMDESRDRRPEKRPSQLPSPNHPELGPLELLQPKPKVFWLISFSHDVESIHLMHQYTLDSLP